MPCKLWLQYLGMREQRDFGRIVIASSVVDVIAKACAVTHAACKVGRFSSRGSEKKGLNSQRDAAGPRFPGFV